jgi:hypothetical protein
MLLRRLTAHVRGENWFAVVLDLLVVVVGLFIGLQIDTRLESVYLMEIREDFEASRLSLEREIREAEQTANDMTILYAQSLLPAPSLSFSELARAS